MSDEFNANEAFEVVPYDPAWARLFAEEAARLEAVMGDEAIEINHVGSTSVPGLSAKPIIDLLLEVECFVPIEDYNRRLEPLGYHWQAHENDTERLFFWKGKPRSHHLHIVEYATWEHQRHLIFRDYLRRYPQVAQEYEKVKRELTAAFPNNRPAYTRGKTAFIKNIMARAVEEILDPSLRSLVEEAITHPPEDSTPSGAGSAPPGSTKSPDAGSAPGEEPAPGSDMDK